MENSTTTHFEEKIKKLNERLEVFYSSKDTNTLEKNKNEIQQIREERSAYIDKWMKKQPTFK